jgi:hypothetical protein
VRTPSDQNAAGRQVQLPFRLEMKRPRKSRLEIDFAGKTAVQVYDGQSGWKLRPYLNRDDAEPFTTEEARSETDRDMDGPLIDYAAKGTRVELEGVERVEGHPAYRLKAITRNGTTQHVWIDAQSYLDIKVDGLPWRLDGNMRNVWIYQRDFRTVHGVKVPFLLETVIEGGAEPHKMVLESVEVNRTLDDTRFAKAAPLVAGSPTSRAVVLATQPNK